MALGGLSADLPAGMQEIASINWQAPWLADWAQWGQPVAAEALANTSGQQPVADALNRALKRHCPQLPIEFVAQSGLPQGMAYEAFIRQQGAVPTRDNAHDFFNGLAWLHSPRIKTRLNELQAAEIADMGVGSTRGPVRDAITVLDENGALLLAPPAIWGALRGRNWQALFLDLRSQWSQCRLWPVGHALQEKLITPRKPMVAHVLDVPLPVGLNDWPEVDAFACEALHGAFMAGKPFLPMPVMGIPGWCAGNGRPVFYEDSRVFRPARGALDKRAGQG
jgi:hypothetical protein